MPTESHTAEIEGQPLSLFWRAGSGPPLLLLHGLLGGAFCWRLNLDALSRRRTIFAVNLPGLGACDAPRDLDCSMTAQAQRVLFAIRAAKAGKRGCSRILLGWRDCNVCCGREPAACVPWCWQRRSIPGQTLARDGYASSRDDLGSALLRMAWPVSRPLHRVAVERMYGDPTRFPSGTTEGYSSWHAPGKGK